MEKCFIDYEDLKKKIREAKRRKDVKNTNEMFRTITFYIFSELQNGIENGNFVDHTFNKQIVYFRATFVGKNLTIYTLHKHSAAVVKLFRLNDKSDYGKLMNSLKFALSLIGMELDFNSASFEIFLPIKKVEP